MLCPMARSGSSHTSELLDSHDSIHSHHGLFGKGPFGRWPADQFIPMEKKGYYSSILDEDYKRVGGEEHSGEFLDNYIFTDNPKYKSHQWKCLGFKLQFVHFVHMPDLREYLIKNKDIKIIVNTRRHLLQQSCAEYWCKNGNSRSTRPGQSYDYGNTDCIYVDVKDIRGTFRNLCRYRQYTIETFDDGERDFFEWSYEDMFHEDGSINIESHKKLFDFLEIPPSKAFSNTFSQTPRPSQEEYFTNYQEVKNFMTTTDAGIFKKYFSNDYNPWKDYTWPVMEDYRLDEVIVEKDNNKFRS